MPEIIPSHCETLFLIICMLIYVNDVLLYADCSEEDLGRGAAYARPVYPSSAIDPVRSGIFARDERIRGSSLVMLPSSYGAGRV